MPPTPKTKLAHLALKLAQPETARAYHQYQKSQYWSPKKLQKHQETQIKKILTHAYLHHPFYHQKFQNSGVTPQDFKTISDLARFPTTTTSELKQAIAAGHFAPTLDSKISWLETTGSTGTPFRFPLDQAAAHHRTGAILRTIEWYHHHLGDKTARLWRTSRSQTLSDKLKRNLLGRRLDITIYDADHPEDSWLDDNKLNSIYKKLKTSGIKILDGYVSALTLLAQYVTDQNLELNLDSVVTGAEYLSPQARNLIETAFNCRVYNRYGGTEIGWIAHQCSKAKGEQLHVLVDKLHLEILKNHQPVKPGELGEIVITDFTNTALPFIRFQIEDTAIAAKRKEVCQCGRTLPSAPISSSCTSASGA